MELATVRKGRTDANQLAANKRFKRYDVENEHPTRDPDIKSSPALGKIIDVWKEVIEIEKEQRVYFQSVHGQPLDYVYDIFVDFVENLEYSSEDVEKFSLILAQFQDDENFSDRAGQFLSALINCGKDDDYVIHTSHLAVPLRYIGAQNKKNVTVKGDVGSTLGYMMESGTLTVEGNAESHVASKMINGRIIIKKNAGNYVGHLIAGGTVTIEGNAGSDIGFMRKGGVIHLEGDYDSIRKHWCGEIYHKGVLIVDK